VTASPSKWLSNSKPYYSKSGQALAKPGDFSANNNRIDVCITPHREFMLYNDGGIKCMSAFWLIFP